MAAKPRVLFVVRFLWGDEGISIGLARLAQGLIQHGWDVALASAMVEPEEEGDATRGPGWFESQGIKHFFVPFPNLKTSPLDFPGFFRALFAFNTVVQRFKPDVINVHSLSMCPYAHIIRLRYDIPFVSTARIEPKTSGLSVRLGALANRHIKSFLGDRFIAISTEVKIVYQQTLQVPEQNIRLICHGVDSDYFRPPSLEEQLATRQAFGLKPDARVVCLIGRLDPVKGHDVLYQAIALLKAEGLDINALCAGTGGRWKESIQAQPAEMGIADQVHFVGFTDPRTVLWASDVLVLPSRREGFGWVIPESMLCGVVPIRTPSAGAIDQIEPGVNGFIISFNDANALASCLKQCFIDNKRRTEMSTAALATARQKFTAERMTKATITVYEEVIAEMNARGVFEVKRR